MAFRPPATAILGALAALLLSTASASAQDDANAIAGTWLTENGASKVEVTCNAGACGGKVTWIKVAEGAPAPLDAKNSDASLRTRPLVGVDVLSGFTYKGNQTWDGGKVYSPAKGNSYNGTLTLNRDGTLSVKAKAGIGSKTVTWTRT